MCSVLFLAALCRLGLAFFALYSMLVGTYHILNGEMDKKKERKEEKKEEKQEEEEREEEMAGGGELDDGGVRKQASKEQTIKAGYQKDVIAHQRSFTDPSISIKLRASRRSHL